MKWFDDIDDDAADPRNFDTRSQITVDQLLSREGFRPGGSRFRRRKLTGFAWVAVGAVVGGVLWHQPIGTLLTSGSTTDVMPESAQRPSDITDPRVRAATEDGATAAVPHGNQPPAVPDVPKPPVLVVVPPAASTVSTKPRSTRDGRTVRLHAVPPALAHVVTPAVAQVAPVVAPVMPVATSATDTMTQPSFGWFDSDWSRFGGQFYGGYWGSCGGWGR